MKRPWGTEWELSSLGEGACLCVRGMDIFLAVGQATDRSIDGRS